MLLFSLFLYIGEVIMVLMLKANGSNRKSYFFSDQINKIQLQQLVMITAVYILLLWVAMHMASIMTLLIWVQVMDTMFCGYMFWEGRRSKE